MPGPGIPEILAVHREGDDQSGASGPGIDRGGVHPVDAFLDLVVEHGAKVRWRTTISNHRPDVLKKLARDPGVQMGFSDAGAHLRNMAFYNFGLRLLRHVRDANLAGNSFMTVEQAVHRLTGELAEWYGLDAGHLRVGDRADLVVVARAHLEEPLPLTPIDETRTRVFLLNERNVLFFKGALLSKLNGWLDRKVNERNVFIASQDIRVMNEVRPRLTPPTRSKELMMPADKVILQYRDKLDEWEAKGWKLDMEALKAAQAKGDAVFAIPCPARRETNAWVLDEAPRIAPRDPAAQVTLHAAG